MLIGCAPAIQGQKVGVGWTGQGWYHHNKSQQEMWQDYNACKAQCFQSSMKPIGAAVVDSAVCETYCMQGKGYVWQ